MRKGQLIKKDVSTLKAGDSAFCTHAKHFFTVKEIDGEVIHGTSPMGNPCRIRKDSVIIDLKDEDVMTGETFLLNSEQQEYIYKSGKGDNLQFYTRYNQLLGEDEAVVLAKNSKMMALTNEAEKIVDAYAKYVTSQKVNNEPAEKFKDWFFNVSI
ncbi:MAG: hypothetical protein ACTSPC_13640 [Candidatus Heimdallarchaeota archaeon]